MKPKRVALSIGLILAAILAFDVFLLASDSPTISNVFLGWSTAWPFVPFSWGLLLGHLFIPRKVYPAHHLIRRWAAWAIMALGVWLNASGHLRWSDPGELVVCAVVLLGVFAGHQLWPQLKGHAA